jgi:hypothetical protein
VGRSRWVLVLVLASVLAMLASFLRPLPAFAPQDCSGLYFHEHVETAPASTSQRRGVKTNSESGYLGLQTGKLSTSNTCVRVASISNLFSSGDQVEVGWMRRNSGGICVPSTNDFYRFAVATELGQQICIESSPPQLDPNTYYDVRVERDESTPTVWRFYWQGTSFGTYTFASAMFGIPLSLGERIYAGDSAWGRFNGNHYKSSSGWHFWDEAGTPATCYVDDSADWDATPLNTPNAFDVKETGSGKTCGV